MPWFKRCGLANDHQDSFINFKQQLVIIGLLHTVLCCKQNFNFK